MDGTFLLRNHRDPLPTMANQTRSLSGQRHVIMYDLKIHMLVHFLKLLLRARRIGDYNLTVRYLNMKCSSGIIRDQGDGRPEISSFQMILFPSTEKGNYS